MFHRASDIRITNKTAANRDEMIEVIEVAGTLGESDRVILGFNIMQK